MRLDTHFVWLRVVVLWFVLMTANSHGGKVDFSREILPIFSDKCFYCHGPDASHRKAKLRLDEEDNAKKDRDGEKVIFPGNSAKSLLVARIKSEDPDEHMPPASSHKTLTAQQI